MAFHAQLGDVPPRHLPERRTTIEKYHYRNAVAPGYTPTLIERAKFTSRRSHSVCKVPGIREFNIQRPRA